MNRVFLSVKLWEIKLPSILRIKKKTNELHFLVSEYQSHICSYYWEIKLKQYCNLKTNWFHPNVFNNRFLESEIIENGEKQDKTVYI